MTKRREIDERNRHICTLRVRDGLTPTQICRRLKLSRGVVNGVLWREGYSVSRKAQYKSKPPKAPHAPQRRKIVASAIVEGLQDVKALDIEPIPLGTDSGCQWLRGEPGDRIMCGHAVKGRSAWCPHHYDRVYQKVT